MLPIRPLPLSVLLCTVFAGLALNACTPAPGGTPGGAPGGAHENAPGTTPADAAGTSAAAAPATGTVAAQNGPAAAGLHEVEDALRVTLLNGVELHFARHGELLLGLKAAKVDGVDLTSDQTVLRPLLAQEWGDDRMIWPFMRLVEVNKTDGRVEIEAELLGTTDEHAYRAAFVYRADREAALEAPMSEALEAKREKRDEAKALIETHLLEDEQFQELYEERRELRDKRDGVEPLSTEYVQASNQLRRVQARFDRRRSELREALKEDSDELREAYAALDRFEEALEPRAMELGDIHRDYYRFALPRQPAEVNRIDALVELADELEGNLEPAGRIRWVFQPQMRNIAGWQWQGWRHHYDFELDDDRKVNTLRQTGTWELDGALAGTTAVALRYRGLGRIEQAFTASDEENGGNAEAWNTADIIPGAAGSSPAVSPVVPDSEKSGDRGYALRHRIGAWIAQPARGAAAPFVDFQFRPHAALASFHDRQGNWRALSEAYPEDRHLSQTDEQWFALTSRHATEPQVYLALVERDKPLQTHEWRNRWQEVDQYVRDLVSEELDFVQFEAKPGMGMLVDYASDFEGWVRIKNRMADDLVAEWAEEGVRKIAIHNPGWISGRYQGEDGPPSTHGGVCDIYDWVPTDDVEQPWRRFAEACAEHDVAYYIWLGQTQVRNAPFAERVGLDPKHWSLNAPGDDGGPGYGPWTMKGNIHDERFREEFRDTLEHTRREFGYQGFWIDSFQNLFMSQLDWAGNTADSMQRGWWELFAWWSRQGVALMGESHAFPGLSCSIEIRDWPEDHWYFQHVWKWYRGTMQQDYSPEQHDRNAFRLMAAKGWAAPDLTKSDWYHDAHQDAEEFRPSNIIPGYERFAEEYLAALPDMRRSYVLADDGGMLWLPYEGDTRGIWFAFEGSTVPAGVTARPILDGEADAVDEAEEHHTYRVEADDLLDAFNIRRGGHEDPRIGREYRMPEYDFGR